MRKESIGNVGFDDLIIIITKITKLLRVQKKKKIGILCQAKAVVVHIGTTGFWRGRNNSLQLDNKEEIWGYMMECIAHYLRYIQTKCFGAWFCSCLQ